ncbi:MAG TPA: Crp/Fnr family transcriptional regulator [Gaiellaceae bacterium]
MEWQLLAGVPAEDARRLVAIGRRRTFGRGEIVFHQLDPADSLHLVAGGRFAVRRTTPLGEDALLAIRGPGSVFGELALVSDGARSATVQALEPAETLAVYRTDFDELRRRHPQVDHVLVHMLAQEVRRMDELLTESYYVSAERRVLRRLLEVSEAYGGTAPGVEVPLTQEQLAALAGTSRATVNAVLSAERRRGALSLRRGRTTLDDPAALARHAGLPPADAR